MRALCLLVLTLFVAGCAGEVDLPPDGSGGSSDLYVWVDTYVQPGDQGTSWPQPEAGYTGAPFGCQRDSDCFGQRCGRSPGGVKLCAATCE